MPFRKLIDLIEEEKMLSNRITVLRTEITKIIRQHLELAQEADTGIMFLQADHPQLIPAIGVKKISRRAPGEKETVLSVIERTTPHLARYFSLGTTKYLDCNGYWQERFSPGPELSAKDAQVLANYLLETVKK